MRLSELFGEPVQTVAYMPRLRLIAGSVNAAILWCQLLYWTGRQRDPDGWIEKRVSRSEEDPAGAADPSNQSLEFETGLTYRELWRARQLLRKKGFLQERSRRAEHRMFFRLDLEALRRAWKQLQAEDLPEARSTPADSASASFPKRDRQLPESRVSAADGSNDNAAERVSLNGTSRDYTEITAEKPQGILKTEVPLGWSLAHGLPVSEEQLERERAGDKATSDFESALGVREWPWASTRVWEKMVALVSEAWKEDPGIFQEYAEWMEGEGKYKAMSVKQIRANPQQFIDTGWPLFLSSRMPPEPEPVRVQEETDLMRRIREREEANGMGSEPPS
jgi:hypothetical protein